MAPTLTFYCPPVNHKKYEHNFFIYPKCDWVHWSFNLFRECERSGNEMLVKLADLYGIYKEPGKGHADFIFKSFPEYLVPST